MADTSYFDFTDEAFQETLPAGSTALLIAKGNATFEQAGLNATTLDVIIRVTGVPGDYIPNRPLNLISGFELDAGYIATFKQDIDISEFALYFLP